MDTAANKTSRRTPGTVKLALGDIQAHCAGSRQSWRKLMEIAERNMEPRMMMYLAEIRDSFAEIDRLARDAENGVYRGKG